MTPTPSAAALEWFKSSYSSNDGPECVEAALAADAIHIRDSKIEQGPQLAFGATEWAAFLSYAADH
ncbi:DUF397 domain-containing protein [Streptomyces sp. NPDC005329]|uniref:DUF397 domain-containing protein n=1 Tax=Streptomyces sp. NPDC005329 TaxID=3157034 RepID=UPI0033A3071E